ncbi:MAG: serine hydroxymethyltransferase [Pirellulaceae bacterium]|nr:serine hydroxymethyltransferase [Pirellulaceae bacterium]
MHDTAIESIVAESITAEDPHLWELMRTEQQRQASTLELIASENHVSRAVMAAMGSCLTNKYAEGYPGKRYYGGCQHYDQIENLARDRAKQLFGCRFANVQPHAGATANAAVFFALMQPGDTFASLVLPDGGHLSHGLKVNLSGKWFKPVHYPLVYDASRSDFEHIDYDALQRICLEHRPKLILCGYSAYPRIIDFGRFRAVADACGALLVADVAHIAGLVAAGQHPSPFPHAHVVTTTTHKTLRGPRGGLILCDDEEIAAKIDKAVFPGMQGGPLMHIIAAKAVCFGEALQPSFKQYTNQILVNARALGDALMAAGYRLVSGGTDNHLMLVDLRTRDADLTGAEAERWLESAGIITNKNGVPQDPRPPMKTSGLRLGTPALTTRGLTETHMRQVAEWMDRVLSSGGDRSTCEHIGDEVSQLCRQYPMPH